MLWVIIYGNFYIFVGLGSFLAGRKCNFYKHCRNRRPLANNVQ